MTGLEKMMNQILEEANASANSKRAEAAAEADRIKAAAEAEADAKAALHRNQQQILRDIRKESNPQQI